MFLDNCPKHGKDYFPANCVKCRKLAVRKRAKEKRDRAQIQLDRQTQTKLDRLIAGQLILTALFCILAAGQCAANTDNHQQTQQEEENVKPSSP